jgi:probable rRNA maturation factor
MLLSNLTYNKLALCGEKIVEELSPPGSAKRRGHGKMIVIEAARAKTLPAASALGKRDLNRFLACAAKALGLTGEFSVLLTGDERLRALNLQFRGIDKATDVLSFPALPEAANGAQVGDLAISLETALVQASAYGHTLQMEVKILILHGLLHLAGYDHERDQGQMRRFETRLRKQFALPAGLVERSQRARRTAKP